MGDVQPPCALPELARSLRALGSLRDPCDERAHLAVFGPLLDARGEAASARSANAMMHALRGAPLAERIERLVREAARNGIHDAAMARSRAWQAGELIEPLLAALAELDARAALLWTGEMNDPSIRIDGYSTFGSFVSQLGAVFAAADVACGHLSRLLSIAPPEQKPSWRQRGARS